VTDILLALAREKRLKEAAEVGARQAVMDWSPRIPVIIELDAKKLTKKGSTGLALTDPEAFDAIIDRGLRGQLQMESFVTGLLYIALDFHPQSPAKMVQEPGGRYKEIPTLPTTLEEVQTEVKKIFAKFKEVKVDKLIDSATEAIEGLERLINSPEVVSVIRSLDSTLKSTDKLVQNVDSQVAPLSDSFKGTMTDVQKLVQNVNGQVAPLSSSIDDTAKEVSAAMVQAKKTLSTADSAIGEDSPLLHDLTNALTELAAAARSIRVLASYLERNPDSLLYGKR
ncbi:MAG: hypothetical protein ACE5E2_04530, partial [Candidatus Binatia bacterium]